MAFSANFTNLILVNNIEMKHAVPSERDNLLGEGPEYDMNKRISGLAPAEVVDIIAHEYYMTHN